MHARCLEVVARLLALLALLVATGAPASAALVTDSGSVFNADGGSIVLRKFDPSLGTLQSVTLSMQFNIGAAAQAEAACDPFLPCSVSVFVGAAAGTNFQVGSISLGTTKATSGSNNCDAGIFAFNVTCLAVADTVLGTADDSATDAFTLALFSGPGTFSIDYVTRFDATGTFLVRSFGAAATVEYQYAAATPAPTGLPEPGSLALVALAGFLALQAACGSGRRGR